MAPIKVLHTADLHLGTELHGKLNPTTGLNSRVEDYLATLDRMVAAALELEVDVMLLVGDVYRSRDPNPTIQREFAGRVRQLASAGVQLFIVTGNHDMAAAAGRASSVDIFTALEVPGVTVARSARVHRLETKQGQLQIAALPWVLRSSLFVKDEFKNRTIEEINLETANKVERILRALSADSLPNLPTILAAHTTVMGAVYGSEQNVLLGQDIALPRTTLTQANFDYVALGHLHKHQVLGDLPPVVYAGSIERTDFGEEGEPKGYVLVEMEKGNVSFEFHELPVREYLTIDIQAYGPQIMSSVLAAIGRHELTDKVVRLRIKTDEESEQYLDDAELRKALKDAALLSGIGRQVERQNRSRWTGEGLEQLTPEAALSFYCEQRGYSPEQVERLQRYASELFARRHVN